MKSTSAYSNYQSLTLSGESAFEELYTRMARWTEEASEQLRRGQWVAGESRLERAVTLLGFMSRVIDLSRNYEIACSILSLHRFAIGALVKAKGERDAGALEGLPQVFVLLAGIFAAIQISKTERPLAPAAPPAPAPPVP